MYLLIADEIVEASSILPMKLLSQDSSQIYSQQKHFESPFAGAPNEKVGAVPAAAEEVGGHENGAAAGDADGSWESA